MNLLTMMRVNEEVKVNYSPNREIQHRRRNIDWQWLLATQDEEEQRLKYGETFSERGDLVNYRNMERRSI